jgi:ribose transport system substrate-binding protein
MKKSLLLVVALAILALPVRTTAQTETPKSLTLGLVAKAQSNAVFQAARRGAEVAAVDLGKKYGIAIKIDWRTPNDENAQQQADNIEQLVLAGANGIAVSCSDANKVTGAINDAVKTACRW